MFLFAPINFLRTRTTNFRNIIIREHINQKPQAKFQTNPKSRLLRSFFDLLVLSPPFSLILCQLSFAPQIWFCFVVKEQFLCLLLLLLLPRSIAPLVRMDSTYASPSYPDLSSPAMPTTAGGVSRPVKIIPLQHPTAGAASSSSSSNSPASPAAFFSGLAAKWKRLTFLQFVEGLFPCYRWIRTYRWRDDFQVDLVAGLTIGIMLVPQAMSYAKLAGLEPIYGLYTGFVPIFVYAIFGSSRQLAIGPVALVSLLVSNVLRGIAGSSDELYTELAIVLALMVGMLECIMGLLRLGWLLRFISHSVISGFTTASAVVIGLSQAKYFLGYNITQSSKIVPLIQSIIAGADQARPCITTHYFVSLTAGFAFVVLVASFRDGIWHTCCTPYYEAFGKIEEAIQISSSCRTPDRCCFGDHFSNNISSFIYFIGECNVFLKQNLQRTIGEIPQGLPSFSVPKNFGYAKSLIPTAFLITGVAILESVGIAKALAAKNGYELDSSQELVGLGLANIFGSFFSSYPSTGSFSRSAVSNESGAKTGLSGIITGIVMGCALLFLTPLFEFIPQCALAAIVVSAVIGLIEYEEAIFLWRIDKKDFLLWIITCTTTLFLGIEIGVLIGVGVSLAFVIHESANPHIAVLGRLPGTTVYRNVQQYPEAYTYHGIVVVRIDAPIYFANTSYIKDRLRDYEVNVDKSLRRGPEVERIYFVILEMSPVTYIDSSAVQALKDLHHEYKSRDIQIAISNPNRGVLLTLSKAGVVELIGKEWCFVRVHDAVQVCLQQVQSLHRTSSPAESTKPSLFERLLKQRGEDLSVAELESGQRKPTGLRNGGDPNLEEPLLSHKFTP
ncbi:unnamed protein product [Linum tenue]|uniref:STAS domain-containing protein n=1 Tax=Linum tenue TaxID=586396 RepID=A0AAV0MBZ3_9ROSI|nr:unnamed protein product [Linum tenue]